MEKHEFDESKVKHSIYTEKFNSVWAIGKLLFFDYNKNNFGFISEIKTESATPTDKVHVARNGLSSEKTLPDGETVTFILNKGQKGFFATHVKSLSEVKLHELSAFSGILSIDELEKVIQNSVGTEYQNISQVGKTEIYKIVERIRSKNALLILEKIGADKQQIDNYIDLHFSKLKNNEKINELSKSFSFSLLRYILASWTIRHKETILRFVAICQGKNIPPEFITQAFISAIVNLDWTYDEILRINNVFNVPRIKQIALELYDFDSINIEIDLKNLLPLGELQPELIEVLRVNLKLKIKNLSPTQLLKIYGLSYTYNLIQNESELMELLYGKDLAIYEIKEIIKIVSDKESIKFIDNLIQNNKEIISLYELLDLLALSGTKIEIARTLLLGYYSANTSALLSDFPKVLDFLKERQTLELTNYYVDEYYTVLAIHYPLPFFKLAIQTRHIKAQMKAFENLIFQSEKEIINFLNDFSSFKLDEAVISSNKPLSSFINFINAKSDFALTQDCKNFLVINQGIVQCLSVKFLIFQYSEQKISKENLLKILGSFQWTEISALLLITILQESTVTSKILLEKLDAVFHNHFNILSSQSYNSKAFHANFTLRNILPKCNGRKLYNAKLWQKNGISRWYTSGSVSTYIKEHLNCFCEGRSWKKESFWDSESNQPFVEKYEFYWCKTSYCAARNDSPDLNQPFYQWTLSEISAVLNIHIEKIALATLSGWANRINQIVEHLYCRSCNEVLRPVPNRPIILGHYAVPLFHCINEKCSDKQTVRFTHCINGKCESHKNSEPLDSRDCVSCKPNDSNHRGLRCNFCGSGCPVCSGNNAVVIISQPWET